MFRFGIDITSLNSSFTNFMFCSWILKLFIFNNEGVFFYNQSCSFHSCSGLVFFKFLVDANSADLWEKKFILILMLTFHEMYIIFSLLKMNLKLIKVKEKKLSFALIQTLNETNSITDKERIYTPVLLNTWRFRQQPQWQQDGRQMLYIIPGGYHILHHRNSVDEDINFPIK